MRFRPDRFIRVRRPSTILTRILSSVVLLIAATGLLLGLTGVNIIEDFARERYEERMDFLARHLAVNAELGLLIDEPSMLERLANNVLSEKGVVEVIIEDQVGRPVVNAFKQSEPGAARVSRPVTITVMDEENLIFEGGIPHDRILREGIIGTIHILYTDQELKSLVQSLKLRFVLIASGVCALGALLMLFIARSILAPLRYLVEASKRVADGELDLEVQGGHLKETQNLSRSFNTMLRSIRQSREALRQSYEELARQKNMAEIGKFTMILTHEFKNPLGIIKGSLAILKKPEVPRETHLLMIRYMEEEIQQIDHLIEEFLMFSKPKKPDFKLCRCHDVIQRVAEKFRVSLGTHGPQIRVEHGDDFLTCLVDETLFIRALENVLKNAAEVSEPKGMILLKSYAENTSWKVEVLDEGPGIPPEAREVVFEPFYTTKAKGTGLGLAIAANAVQVHQGHIQIVEDPGGRTKFVIRMPLACETSA